MESLCHDSGCEDCREAAAGQYENGKPDRVRLTLCAASLMPSF